MNLRVKLALATIGTATTVKLARKYLDARATRQWEETPEAISQSIDCINVVLDSGQRMSEVEAKGVLDSFRHLRRVRDAVMPEQREAAQLAIVRASVALWAYNMIPVVISPPLEHSS